MVKTAKDFCTLFQCLWDPCFDCHGFVSLPKEEDSRRRPNVAYWGFVSDGLLSKPPICQNKFPAKISGHMVSMMSKNGGKWSEKTDMTPLAHMPALPCPASHPVASGRVPAGPWSPPWWWRGGTPSGGPRQTTPCKAWVSIHTHIRCAGEGGMEVVVVEHKQHHTIPTMLTHTYAHK